MFFPLSSEASSMKQPNITFNWPAHRWTAILLATAGFVLPSVAAGSFAVRGDTNQPPVVFALGEIERAVAGSSYSASNFVVQLEVNAVGLTPQSYRFERDGNRLRVIGGDAAGAMYGGLDIAEAIHLGTLSDLKTGSHQPHIVSRGIKFNIPLDLRTPSYSDNSSSAQANIPEMWSMEFWHELLDQMARDRFNVLTLWNLHPFPSIVKVPEYPDVA